MKKVYTLLIILLILSTLLIGIAFATVADASSRAEFSCNGSTTTFDFTYRIIDTSDILLYHRVDSTGAQTLLTEVTDYSLSATNNDYSSGGTITTVATYASGITLVAIRDIPDSQEATLSDSGVLRLAALEDAYDKLTMLIEQQQEEIDRCLKYPPSDASSISAELPNSVDRASTTLIFDASSEPDVE